jgi:hypothetical protein
MIAATEGVQLDIGPNLLQAIITIIGLVALYLNQRKATRSSDQAAKQSVPNGGFSMRDAIDRIESAQKAQTLQLAAVQDKVKVLEHPAIVTGQVPVVPLVLGQPTQAIPSEPQQVPPTA